MNDDRKYFLKSLVFPFAFLFLLWAIFLAGYFFDIDMGVLGIYPRKIWGFAEILTAPLVHADIQHIWANSLPLLVTSAGLFYFYKGLGYRIFFLVYLLSGFWLWIGGREAYHIGASGLIYGFVSFHFFSGIFRKDMRLMAISLLAVFLYGSMIWGIMPLDPKISWESHLFGAVAGLMLSYYYRKEGPQKPDYPWMHEVEEDDDGADENAGKEINDLGKSEHPEIS